MLETVDWERAGRGPPINHYTRLNILLQRRALLFAAGYQSGPVVERVLRFIHRTRDAIIIANRHNPNPPF